LRLLGLARRAGKLICGLEAVLEHAGGAAMILLASDAGNSVKREALRLNRHTVTLPHSKAELGAAVGRGTCAIAAVTGAAFDRGIKEALQMEGLE
jgi:ribosomal protein L7Ae-like RNA K-turn-binding protein